MEAGRADPDPPPERVPSDALPPPRAWADRNPQADARLRAARPVLEERAEALRMPTENLLTPDTLRRVAWAPPAEITADAVGSALAALGARPWQVAETAGLIAEAFVSSTQGPGDPSDPAS